VEYPQEIGLYDCLDERICIEGRVVAWGPENRTFGLAARSLVQYNTVRHG
jgi:hypothetical protein